MHWQCFNISILPDRIILIDIVFFLFSFQFIVRLVFKSRHWLHQYLIIRNISRPDCECQITSEWASLVFLFYLDLLDRFALENFPSSQIHLKYHWSTRNMLQNIRIETFRFWRCDKNVYEHKTPNLFVINFRVFF